MLDKNFLNKFLDIDFIISILPLFQKAFILTIEISFFGILFSIILGFLLSLILYYRIRFFQSIARFYIEISRNTPLIIQLFFLYFGLYYFVELSNFTCAIIGVTFLGGSYMAESFLLGLKSVKKSQIESALALGFNRVEILRFVILPQGLGLSMSAICANVLFLIKETSIVGVIGLQDLMSFSKELIGNYAMTNEALFLLIVAYIIILLPLSIIFSYLESWYRKHL
ncbi:ABC transporter permease subunit [Helicobacter saguini]|uniref:ABC transporter permease subunit n=1 Tax=Helicobacter saguini TaxID=1548018 RepID=A0A347VQ75_9HELI|nr:amino acid ABC transporter permease [Helicobacter saguini]MWV61048.1 ABC transporter permease subunit [Helicobacter saguini]MWV68283.1 ABC transporter permease subunit [Helicobacter saguini]MWV70252.1 ABC transporter permease subunit [Helicobacter saguini]MWV72155.1 ABC transporter permease subunit [Helicobacter saguini]TLD95216.1 amino acid ABC transporter permease [Helicobacter saguini]